MQDMVVEGGWFQPGSRRAAAFPPDPSPLWGGWHTASVASDVPGGGSARQCAEISLAEAAPRPTGLRPATLPTRGRDKEALHPSFTPRYAFAFPRRDAPGFCKKPSAQEGVGNAGCPVHPQPRVRWG